MNIDKIVKECQKALNEWIYYSTPIKNGLEIQISSVRFTASKDIIIGVAFPDGYLFEYSIHFRELYDYFDSVGIVISLQYDSVYGYWDGKIITEDIVKDTEWSYKERVDAEYLVIPIAFEIREQQLNNSK